MGEGEIVEVNGIRGNCESNSKGKLRTSQCKGNRGGRLATKGERGQVRACRDSLCTRKTSADTIVREVDSLARRECVVARFIPKYLKTLIFSS